MNKWHSWVGGLCGAVFYALGSYSDDAGKYTLVMLMVVLVGVGNILDRLDDVEGRIRQ